MIEADLRLPLDVLEGGGDEEGKSQVKPLQSISRCPHGYNNGA